MNFQKFITFTFILFSSLVAYGDATTSGMGLKMEEDMVLSQKLGQNLSVELNVPKYKCKGLSRLEQLSYGFQAGLDRFCSCFITVSPETGKLTYENSYDLCAERYCWVEYQKNITDKDYSKTYQKTKGEIEVTNFDNAHLCTASDSRKWLRDYKNAQKDAVENLAEDVDEEVCGSKTHHYNNATKKTNKSKVVMCRDKGLRNLVEEYLPGMFSTCQSDYANKGKKKRVNDCTKRKAYSFILAAHKGGYFIEFCAKKLDLWDKKLTPDNISSINTCTEKLNKTLISLYYKKELDACKDESLFNTPEAIKTCRNILLEKTLAFTSDDQLKGIGDCLDKTGEEEIKSCIGDILITPIGDDVDEKNLLAQLEKEYCSVQKDEKGNVVKELDENESKECLKKLVMNNLDEVEDAEECLNLPSAAKISCQRKLIFKKLLADKAFDVEDCWNTKKYETIKDRKECSERAAEVAEKAEKCEKKTGIQAQIKCFQKIGDDEFANSYLLRKYGMFFKECEKNPAISQHCSKREAYLSCKDQPSDKLQTCLINLMDQGLLAQVSDTNQQCLQAVDANACFEKQKALEQIESGSSELTGFSPGTQTNPNGTTVIPGGTNTVSGTTNANGTVTKDGLTLNSKPGEGNPTGVTGDNSVANASDFGRSNDSGIKGLFKDFKYMKLKDANPGNGSNACRSMKRAAYLRAGGLVVGIVTIVASGIAAKKHLDKNKDNKQNAAWEAMGIVSAGAVAGVGIKLGANMWAKNMISGAITEETMRRNTAIASGATPETTRTYCTSKKKKKTSYLFENSKELFYGDESLKKASHSTVAQISNSNSEDEIAKLYAEWEAYKDGENIYIPEKDEDLFYLQGSDEEQFTSIKEDIIKIVEFAGGLFIPKAYAQMDIASLGGAVLPLLGGVLNDALDKSKAKKEANKKTAWYEKVNNGDGKEKEKEENVTTNNDDAALEVVKKKGTEDVVVTENDELKEVNKQMDNLEKMDALVLLMDYGDTIGVDVTAYTQEGQAAAKKESLMKEAHNKFLADYGGTTNTKVEKEKKEEE